MDQINNRALEKYRDVPFQDVQQEAERIFAAFIAQVESMSEEELSDPGRFEWSDGESRGERAAAMLREHGYQARALDGGYPGWKEQGFPVEEVSLK